MKYQLSVTCDRRFSPAGVCEDHIGSKYRGGQFYYAVTYNTSGPASEAAADVVFVVDESGSVHLKREWIKDVCVSAVSAASTVSAVLAASTVSAVLAASTVSAVLAASTVSAVLTASTVSAVLFASTVSAVLGASAVSAASTVSAVLLHQLCQLC